MRKRITIVTTLVLLTAACGTSFSQTRCVWIEKYQNGGTESEIGISQNLVKALAGSGGNFDLDGVHLSFDTLLYASKTGKTIEVQDSGGNGGARILLGRFNQPMKESANKHHYLMIENKDSSGAVKTTKLRAESLEAVGVIAAMIGGKDLDDTIDKIESVFKPGGMVYVHDIKKNSSVWIYVN